MASRRKGVQLRLFLDDAKNSFRVEERNDERWVLKSMPEAVKGIPKYVYSRTTGKGLSQSERVISGCPCSPRLQTTDVVQYSLMQYGVCAELENSAKTNKKAYLVIILKLRPSIFICTLYQASFVVMI